VDCMLRPLRMPLGGREGHPLDSTLVPSLQDAAPMVGTLQLYVYVTHRVYAVNSHMKCQVNAGENSELNSFSAISQGWVLVYFSELVVSPGYACGRVCCCAGVACVAPPCCPAVVHPDRHQCDVFQHGLGSHRRHDSTHCGSHAACRRGVLVWRAEPGDRQKQGLKVCIGHQLAPLA